MLRLTICPTCGSDKLKKVCRDLHNSVRGQSYFVPDLEFHECPDCQEHVYDLEAMRKIESYSPTYATRHPRKKDA